MGPDNTEGTSDMQRDTRAQINAAALLVSACADGTFVNHPLILSDMKGVVGTETRKLQRKANLKNTFISALLAQTQVEQVGSVSFM